MDAIPQSNITGYPSQYARAVEGRWYRRLGPVSGLADFNASQVVLKTGASSSQRHWNEDEDELVIMLSGESILVDNNGRTGLRARDVSAFPQGDVTVHGLAKGKQGRG